MLIGFQADHNKMFILQNMREKGYQINQLAVSLITHTELRDHFLPQDFWICKACKTTEKYCHYQ